MPREGAYSLLTLLFKGREKGDCDEESLPVSFGEASQLYLESQAIILG